MAEEKTMNRGLIVLGALVIQLCLGAIYAWSVFTPKLRAAVAEGGFGFSATQTQAVFSVGLVTFAVVMVLAGRWQAKVGPRRVALSGGILLGLGYILAKFLGTTFIGQIVCIGLIGGAGIGLAYVCPIAVGMKWFPDKKGMITGLAVAGFGFGALIWIKLAGSWGGLIDSMGILNVFGLYGIIFLIAVSLASFVMVNPPKGWTPPGYVPPAPGGDAKKGIGCVELQPAQMLRTPQFYMVWIVFVFSSMAGLMTIGIIKLFGIDALQANGMSAVEASAVAGTAMAVFYSLANGIGRIVWGTLSDKLGRKMSIFLMTATQGVMMLLFYFMGGTTGLLYLGAAIIGFNFGGNFSLFPTCTSDFFGPQHVGQNYGWMFTAYGIGGIVGPIMAGMFRDSGSWLPAFIISGILCLVAAGITMATKPPQLEAKSA
ncbi:MAG: OFA family MFS transporter [Thermoleophilia bacterium]|nr:OFA family MFS transporter [Thermoleophilia bacterium]